MSGCGLASFLTPIAWQPIRSPNPGQACRDKADKPFTEDTGAGRMHPPAEHQMGVRAPACAHGVLGSVPSGMVPDRVTPGVREGDSWFLRPPSGYQTNGGNERISVTPGWRTCGRRRAAARQPALQRRGAAPAIADRYACSGCVGRFG